MKGKNLLEYLLTQTTSNIKFKKDKKLVRTNRSKQKRESEVNSHFKTHVQKNACKNTLYFPFPILKFINVVTIDLHHRVLMCD